MSSAMMSSIVSQLRRAKSVADVLEVLSALGDMELSRAERWQAIHQGALEIRGVSDVSAVRTVLLGVLLPTFRDIPEDLADEEETRTRSDLGDDVRRLLDGMPRDEMIRLRDEVLREVVTWLDGKGFDQGCFLLRRIGYRSPQAYSALRSLLVSGSLAEREAMRTLLTLGVPPEDRAELLPKLLPMLLDGWTWEDVAFALLLAKQHWLEPAILRRLVAANGRRGLGRRLLVGPANLLALLQRHQVRPERPELAGHRMAVDSAEVCGGSGHRPVGLGGERHIGSVGQHGLGGAESVEVGN